MPQGPDDRTAPGATPAVRRVSCAARAAHLLATLALLAASGCGGGGGSAVGPGPDPRPPVAGPPSVAAVVLSADSVQLAPGALVRLTADVRDSIGRPLAGREVTWRSSSAAIASVAGGTVTGVAAGSALVIAESGGRADTARVVVVATPPLPTLVEGRALWVSRFEYDSPQKIAEIMTKARSANFNIVYFQVRGAGDAYYRSSIEPCAAALCGRLGGGTLPYDPLDVAVREAHARGLQLHAWINALTGLASGASASCAVLVESAAGQPRHMLLANPGWAVRTATGAAQPCPNAEEYVYVSPGIAAVRTHLARVAADIARRYAVDGIHLDRIRYPGTAWSYDSASLAGFGRSPSADAAGWAQYRRDMVSLAVRETRDSVRAARPAARLSAAVWGIHRDLWGWNSSHGFGQYLQDPRAWAAGGYLDVAVPMTYYAIHATRCGFADWACLLDDHLAGIQATTGVPVFIGIGASRGATEVTAQIRLGRARGVRGFALYSYGAVDAAGLWSVLAADVFAQAATAP
jgi:uncharacterized lipoprotein YddW (UPF0748 family)